MSSVQRGIYQPLADKVPIYDLADEDPEEERSRAPLLVIIALVVLAAFAGVVWIAYNQGVERGRQGASLVITAPEGPVRVAPPAEAASATDFTNLQVYNNPIPPEQEAKASALAPQAPIPAAAPAEAPQIRLSQAVPPPAPAAPPRPAAAPAAQKAAPAPTAQKAAPAPVQVAQAAPSAPASRPAQPAAAPPAAQATGRALTGAAILQIGAFESAELANGAWAAFRSRYPIAAQLSPDVQRADLGAKGVVYRLRIGPFSDRTAAADACGQLRAAGASCFVTTP